METKYIIENIIILICFTILTITFHNILFIILGLMLNWIKDDK